MPMIYGEREKAFKRLQQHIIQKSKDESIFAWDIDFPDSIRAYSRLYAPSPLAYARCSEIIKTDGSRGFSENNGELLIWSRLSRRSQETFYALLNCTDKTYPESRVYIAIGNTSTEGEYVRVRDTRGIGRGLMPAEDMTPFQEQQIRVLVDPIKPPVNDILKGFRIRTLQPPGHHQCHMTILSNSRNSKAGYVCQDEYNQGATGIVHLDPILSSDHSGWSKLHWIVLSFDEEFNPMIMLANSKFRSKFGEKSQDELKQAMVTGQAFHELKEFMDEAVKYMRSYYIGKWELEKGGWMGGMFPELQRELPWPFGYSVLIVDKSRGLRELIIDTLNLRVSVELQPRHTTDRISARNIDKQSLTLEPLSEWAVEITDAGKANPEKRHREWLEDYGRK